ncbi:hypothetical protein Pla123a_37890 [Posidoniimonas polymericola]|uniref:Response regulatory domain-containing protein n=1 Tax=Posidoniimonas polymericola TaxID=2528002 RepID=A0A5C5YEI5_9BACT|nr:response regulator transcription factor [Posidoniimonas polymericola]TWT73454.1 hypothetical protein Pla123a_37890 [Posidoniimonas polymericola]
MSSATLTPPSEDGVETTPLPARLKLLCVTTLHNAAGWINQALASEISVRIKLEESVGATSALSRLREEAFDAVIVLDDPETLDGVGFIEAMRGGGHDEAAIVLGSREPTACTAEAYASGADAYCCIRQTTPRVLLCELRSAIRRCELERQNRRLHQAERQRLSIEHQEAERLLAEQRGLLVELNSLRNQQDGLQERPGYGGEPSSPFPRPAASDLPEALVANYRDVLRAYVIMGVGNLTVEMAKLAELLAAAGVSAHRAVQLHLDVLEKLVRGLGSRSTRHVMNRADLLVLELMIHLADGYRRRYQDVESPPEQLLLPGFGCEDRPAQQDAA